MTRYLHLKFMFATFTASFGSGFQFGYNTSILDVPSTVIQEWITDVIKKNLSKDMSETYKSLIWSLTVAAFPLGGVVGAIIANLFFSNYGPRITLIYNNIPTIIGYILLFCSERINSYGVFILGRMLTGLSAGINGVVCPIYLCEISPVQIRGAISLTFHVMISIGIFTSQLGGILLEEDRNWYYIFLCGMVVSIYQIIGLMLCPESPKFLLFDRNDEEKAKRAMDWFRNGEDVEAALESLKDAYRILQEKLPKVGWKIIWDHPKLRKNFINCSVIMVGQQTCGIHTVIIYSTELFSGFEDIDPHYGTLSIGLILAIVATIMIFLIEILGRRLMLLISFMMMALITTLLSITLTVSQHLEIAQHACLLLIGLFTASYAFGAGGIPWNLTTELFPHTARALAAALTVTLNFTSNYGMQMTYLALRQVFKHYVFLIYAFLNFVFYFYTYAHVEITVSRPEYDILMLEVD